MQNSTLHSKKEEETDTNEIVDANNENNTDVNDDNDNDSDSDDNDENKINDDNNYPWAWLKAVNDMITNPPFDDELYQPIELAPWLYLSNLECAQNIRSLQQNLGITHVLTTNKFENQKELKTFQDSLQQVNIQHCYVPGLDEFGYDMIGKHWETCYQFLCQVKEQNKQQKQEQEEGHYPKKVVVHCNAGMNRSGLIVAAALLVMEGNDNNHDDDDNNLHDDDGDSPPPTKGEDKNNNNSNCGSVIGSTSGQQQQQSSSSGSSRTLLEVVRYLKEKRGLVLTNITFQSQLCLLAQKHGKLGEKPKGYSDSPETIP